MRLSRTRWAFSLALAAILLAASPLAALDRKLPEGPVFIEADELSYEGDGDLLTARGKAVVTFTGGLLKAETVTFYRTLNRAVAEGDVFLRSEGDEIRGQELSFDLADKTGTIRCGSMFIARNHLYVRGEEIAKTGEASYQLRDAFVTSCDGPTPDWQLAAGRMDLTVDGYGTMRHGRFLVREIPVFYLPYLIFPAKTTRQSGLLFPHLSHSRDKNGLDVEVPFYWAVSQSADATFFQRYMEKRGFKEGIELRYFPAAHTFGTFYGDFIRDRLSVTEEDPVMGRSWQGGRSRWSYYLNHETSLGDGLLLRADVARVSDRWYFRDFASFNYYRTNYDRGRGDLFERVPFQADESLPFLASQVRLSKDWPLYNLTGLVRYTDDLSLPSNDATLQKYPEVGFTAFPRPLAGTPLLMEMSARYDNFWRRTGQAGHFGEVSPLFQLPVALGPLQITPRAGLSAQLWQRTDDASDRGIASREIFHFATAVTTEAERVYGVEGDQIEKIRHGIKPELVYTYVSPDSPAELPDFLPPSLPQHTVSLGLTNTLLARMRTADGRAAYRQLMRFKAAQSYDIREARREGSAEKRRPFGDVLLELDLSPYEQLFMAARHVYSVSSGQWKQTNYDLALSDKRGDTLAASYRFTKDVLEEVNVLAKASLTPQLEANYLLRHNRREGRTIEATYGLKFRRQCWSMDLALSDRQDDRSLMLTFHLVGLGSLKAW